MRKRATSIIHAKSTERSGVVFYLFLIFGIQILHMKSLVKDIIIHMRAHNIISRYMKPHCRDGHPFTRKTRSTASGS